MVVVTVTEAQVGTHSGGKSWVTFIGALSASEPQGASPALGPRFLWGGYCPRPVSGPALREVGCSVMLKLYLHCWQTCLSCEVTLVFFLFNVLPGKHKSSRVKDVAAAVHRKLQTFMEITLEEDSRER